MELSLWAWIGFCSFLAGMLALDLGVFHRKAHVVTFREAMVWSLVWISLALGFSWLLLLRSGPQPAMEFLTGYVIEKSLSVDNVFVFAMIFSAMKVPRYCEHKVLFWGVFGALTMRVIMIVAGFAILGVRSLYFALSGLMEKFCYLKYGLAGVLGFVGVKMMLLDVAPIPISVSLMVVASIAMLSTVASLLRRSPEPCTSETP